MSSVDVDTSDEKENASAMPSLETDTKADRPMEMEDIDSTPVKEKVATVSMPLHDTKMKTNETVGA